MASPTRTFLVLGPAGAGKSTLINKLCGGPQTNVSNDIGADGTMGVEVCRSSSATLVDTPGLDSVNASTTSFGVLRQLAELHVEVAEVFLVVPGHTQRITVWFDKLVKLCSELFKPGHTILVSVVWTFGLPPQTKQAQLEEMLLREARITVISQVHWEALTEIPYRQRAMPVQVSPVPRVSTVRSILPQQPSESCGLHMHMDPKLRWKSASVGTAIASAVKELMMMRTRDDGTRFTRLKLEGGAVLIVHVYKYLKHKQVQGDWEALAMPFLSNSPAHAPNLFFERHVAAHFARLKHPNESLSARGKADMVEALLAYISEQKQKTYNMLVMELFRLGQHRGECEAKES